MIRVYLVFLMFHPRRVSIGFVIRLVIAILISLLVWWLATTPFDRLPLSRNAIIAFVRILDFPVALSGELLYPIRGMELVFNDHNSWCDFCPAGGMFRLQMRIAIPTYFVLMYIPNIFLAVARRNLLRFKRIIIGLLIYAVSIAFFLGTGDSMGRGDVRIAAMCFLILSVASAIAWSQISRRSKIIAVVAVFLVGAWVLRFMMRDEVQLYYVSCLLLIILGVGGTLWFTWAIDNSIPWWQCRRLENRR